MKHSFTRSVVGKETWCTTCLTKTRRKYYDSYKEDLQLENSGNDSSVESGFSEDMLSQNFRVPFTIFLILLFTNLSKCVTYFYI